jgi:hypothetical protein
MSIHSSFTMDKLCVTSDGLICRKLVPLTLRLPKKDLNLFCTPPAKFYDRPEADWERDFLASLPDRTAKDRRFCIAGLKNAVTSAITTDHVYGAWLRDRPEILELFLKNVESSGDNIYLLFSSMTVFVGYKEMPIQLVGNVLIDLVRDVQERIWLIMRLIALRPKFFTVGEVDLVRLIERWLGHPIGLSNFQKEVYAFVTKEAQL